MENDEGRREWIKNDGKRPVLDFVDLKLNADEPGYPGIPMVRFWERPEDWDWMDKGSCAITHYRLSGFKP